MSEHDPQRSGEEGVLHLVMHALADGGCVEDERGAALAVLDVLSGEGFVVVPLDLLNDVRADYEVFGRQVKWGAGTRTDQTFGAVADLVQSAADALHFAYRQGRPVKRIHVVDRGWFCPQCRKVFTTPVRTEDGNRWHNMGCGTPMVRCEVIEKASLSASSTPEDALRELTEQGQEWGDYDPPPSASTPQEPTSTEGGEG